MEATQTNEVAHSTPKIPGSVKFIAWFQIVAFVALVIYMLIWFDNQMDASVRNMVLFSWVWRIAVVVFLAVFALPFGFLLTGRMWAYYTSIVMLIVHLPAYVSMSISRKMFGLDWSFNMIMFIFIILLIINYRSYKAYAYHRSLN